LLVHAHAVENLERHRRARATDSPTALADRQVAQRKGSDECPRGNHRDCETEAYQCRRANRIEMTACLEIESYSSDDDVNAESCIRRVRYRNHPALEVVAKQKRSFVAGIQDSSPHDRRVCVGRFRETGEEIVMSFE
jgi:hypothetical protein